MSAILDMILHNDYNYLESYNLSVFNINKPLVLRNLPSPILYEEALRYESSSIISQSGALIVASNKYTGRVPKEKRFVCDEQTKETVHWGEINIPIDAHTFAVNRARALDYLNSRKRIYVVDGFAGWDSTHRIKVRTICSRAYHALFMTNMLIMPTDEECESYGEPDYTIINGGVFPANRETYGVTSDASIIINFAQQEMVILGTEYAGEMKKGVFTIMNYLMPQKNILPMHCAANTDDEDNTTLFFGLSGTGKTTLSSDHSRKLVGDDEHCWTDQGIFNIEGGCYAKCTDPPDDIKECLIFGALLENVVYDNHTRSVDYHDESITTNTRGAYPLEHVKNAKIPGVASSPRNVIFLTCDAFGILPPIAALDEIQAMYHFISGYTAKIPNTEVGVTTPTTIFSACFGEVFLPCDPVIYAHMFAQKIRQHQSKVWLINTGWVGGDYQTGTRMALQDTRAIITKICNNDMEGAEFIQDPLFRFQICTSCEGIDHSLDPRKAWSDDQSYDIQAKKLVQRFHENIAKYNNSSFIEGGPITL